MAFSMAAQLKLTLEDAGYTFVKVDQHQWDMMDGQRVVGSSRALGDLLRKQGKELGVW